jgi:hypothetical protein
MAGIGTGALDEGGRWSLGSCIAAQVTTLPLVSRETAPILGTGAHLRVAWR